jgi:hypothetical protein
VYIPWEVQPSAILAALLVAELLAPHRPRSRDCPLLVPNLAIEVDHVHLAFEKERDSVLLEAWWDMEEGRQVQDWSLRGGVSE